MREINLLQIHRAIPTRAIKLIRGAKIGAILLLVFYCVVVGGIFSFWLILRRQNEVVVKKIAFQEQRINDLKQVESLHAFLKQRLSALSPLFAKETMDYKETLTRLEALVPEGVILTNMGLNQEGNLGFSGTAPNAVVFADFLERLLVSGRDEFAEDVELSSTSRQEDGSYQFTLKINVKS